MRKKIIRTIAIIMICCISFLFVGCAGTDPEEYGEDTPENTYFNLYGTKVLYRPLEYDYDLGSGAEEGQTNDYYGKYAYSIIEALYQLYGITSKDGEISRYIPSFNLEENEDYFYYLYDSIRYQVNTIGYIKDESDEITGFVVGADTSSKWKWTFDYNLNEIEAFLCDSDFVKSYDMIYSQFLDYDDFLLAFAGFYENLQAQYKTIYLGTASATDNENFSDFVKALEYVIYSYALDLEPHQITVTTSPSVDHPYTVNIAGYTSVDEALTYIINLFKRIGSFVGLTQRQITQISNWIKENVIGIGGNNPSIKNDILTIYNTVTTDGDGNYIFDPSDSSSVTLGRNYSEAVDNIVKLVCEKVSIGHESDGSDLTVDNRFLASQISEYAGTSFMVSDDRNFPSATDYDPKKPYIQALEYQSAVLMFSEKTEIMDVWVALKYDADEDGTEPGVWNEDKYLDIIVELNYYNHDANKFFNLASQQTRVYDGPFEMGTPDDGGEFPDFLPQDHGVVCLSPSLDNPELKDLFKDGEYADGLIPIGTFNTNVGNGILKTDIGNNSYKGPPYNSQSPLLLTGTTDVRKYYSIIEPGMQEDLGNKTYITGRLNSAMFSGADGSDYLEITYKVLKTKGDITTNYKFYTGIAMVWA